MKTLLIDGQWCLKKNFYKRKSLKSNGNLCGGTFGFLESLKAVLNRTLPDRVIVMWDGFNSGLLRFNEYKPYKAKRKNYLLNEEKIYTTEVPENDKDAEKISIYHQKRRVQKYLDELFVRQTEVDTIEADDLIAHYALNRGPDEEIIIYSRDGDFFQLVSEGISVLNPDKFKLVTIDNFKEVFGYTVENELMLKCFKGDDSDEIPGINGITKENLLEKFPDIANEKYTYNRLVEECYEQKEKKKIKYYDKIIHCRSELYRNAKLMDLRRPFLNEEAKTEIYDLLKRGITTDDRSIKKAMSMFVEDGFTEFVGSDMVDYFFSIFYNIMNKEKYSS